MATSAVKSVLPTGLISTIASKLSLSDNTPLPEKKAQSPEHPPRADLRKDIYRPLPIVNYTSPTPPEDPSQICKDVLTSLQDSTAGAVGPDGNSKSNLEQLFYDEQSYWRDSLAFTFHFRTFNDKELISKVFLERAAKTGLENVAVVPGTARLTPAGPTMTWIDCFFTFSTKKPATNCGGMLQLLPSKEVGGKWKIWTLATWISDYDGLEENQALLKEPSVKNDIQKEEEVEVDALIIGAGNSGLCTAARFKAYGIKYLAIDKMEHVGDNWATRYENLQFHIEKSFAATPYLPYPDNAPNYLHRDDLAAQCKRFAETFDLNIWLNTTVKSTKQVRSSQGWSVVLNNPAGERTVHAQHLVQATGIGSRVPYTPTLDNSPATYQGLNIHSQFFKSGILLKDQGIKSAIVVGAANSAFDVIDCLVKAGIETTMIQRGSTYVFPSEYNKHPFSLGIYNALPAEIADSVTMAGPIAVGGQLLQGVHKMLFASEPHRYDKLRERGFKIDEDGDLMETLMQKCGQHYMELGQSALIADGKIALKSGVQPVAYTSTGLKFSDDSTVSADAIIWCTGYSDISVRDVAEDILGDGGAEIASKMEATWAFDIEGETRGIWKRHRDIENFWIAGGFTSIQRYYSRFLAIQIKAALAGKLPLAYLETPKTA